MSNVEQSSSGSDCPSCNATLIAGAKFCHQCGAPAGVPADAQAVGQERNRQQPGWKIISLVVVGVAVWSTALMFVVPKFFAEKSPVKSNPHVGARMPSEPSAQSVDLSTMTPREAADRLFNRVMAADEQGDTGQIMQFGPMALEAYKLVGLLDADARYHIGLISLSLGDLDNAREQIKNLESEAPDHLLALTLSFKVAGKAGDARAASIARSRFAAAYDAEIKGGRPEYEAHSVTIETFRASTMPSNSNGTSGQMAAPSPR